MEREEEKLAKFLYDMFVDYERHLRDIHTKYVESCNNDDVSFREYSDAKETYLTTCGSFVADLLRCSDIIRGELLHG